MNPQEYLKKILITGGNITSTDYLQLGIIEESGEIAGKLKKYMRGDFPYKQLKESIKKEIGDLSWYLVLYAYVNGYPIEKFREPHEKDIMKNIKNIEIMKGRLVKADHPRHQAKIIESLVGCSVDLASSFGYTMDEITNANIEKTMSRLARNKIRGSGDER